MATAPDLRPELESGDRMSRDEFHRRYCLRPDIRKAELINGVVYVPSPVRWGKHSKQNSLALLWLGTYAAERPELGFGHNATILLGEDDEVQPDAFLFRLTGAGAGARVTDDDYIEGAPEFVMEIAASTVSYDLHDKKEAYRRAGVPEYVVWRVIDGAIDWFRLQNGEYVRIEPDPDGIIVSTVFPGLRLNVAAMLADDRPAVLVALRPRA